MSEVDSDRIMGYLYLFAMDAGGLFEEKLWPVVVVAVRGQVGDWAAYIAGVKTLGSPTPELQALVYREGTKLNEAQARGFFPHIEGEYRR